MSETFRRADAKFFPNRMERPAQTLEAMPAAPAKKPAREFVQFADEDLSGRNLVERIRSEGWAARRDRRTARPALYRGGAPALTETRDGQLAANICGAALYLDLIDDEYHCTAEWFLLSRPDLTVGAPWAGVVLSKPARMAGWRLLGEAEPEASPKEAAAAVRAVRLTAQDADPKLIWDADKEPERILEISARGHNPFRPTPMEHIDAEMAADRRAEKRRRKQAAKRMS